MGGIGALLAAGPDQALGRQHLQHLVEHHPFQTVLDQPGAELAQHARVEAGIDQFQPRAYFQSIARATINPAWRSVRFSTYCNTVTSANAPGDSAGAPRMPNAAANCSSPKTSRARRARSSPGCPSDTPPGPPPPSGREPAALAAAASTPRTSFCGRERGATTAGQEHSGQSRGSSGSTRRRVGIEQQSRRWAQTRRGTRPGPARGVGQAGRPGLARGSDDPVALDVEVIAGPGVDRHSG